MRVKSLKELDLAAETFLKRLLAEGKGESALVVGLYGDLGAGKTAFTKSFAKALGIEGITSPTFVIEKMYELKGRPWKRFIHIDAYRLDAGDEILKLGFKEAADDPDNLIFVEWPERIESAMPEHIEIDFAFISDTEREFSIKN